MKKEHVAVMILGLFIFGYVLDYVAGPLNLNIKSPFAFFVSNMLQLYPFSAVSIFIKTVAIVSSVLLLFSFIEKNTFAKSLVLFVLAALFELYSIQAVVSGALLIQMQWILSLTASGILLLIFSLLFLVIGTIQKMVSKVVKKEQQNLASSDIDLDD